MNKPWLRKLVDTNWVGSGELWLDPEGNNAELYECKLQVKTNALYYTWVHDDKIIEGSFTFDEAGAIWVDSWHQPESTECVNVPDSWGLFTVKHSYNVPSSPNWGWITKLSERPNGNLVLQMSNLAPWGEEGRAVRMIFTRM